MDMAANLNNTKTYDIVSIDRNNFIESFFKIYIEHLAINKYNADKKDSLSKQEDIIFENSETIITCSNRHGLAGLFAVQDLMNKNRFIIIVSYYLNRSCVQKASGIIIYFDEYNKRSSRITLNKNILQTYDNRNGYLNMDNTFLRNQFLISINIDRNTGRLLLYVNEFNYDDDCINHIELYNCDIYLERYFNYKVYNNRIVSVSNKSCIDISSFIFDKTTFKFDYYNYESIEDFIKNFNEKNYDDKYNDIYPLNCIRCNKKTSSITEYYKGMMYLGSGVCEECLIRYSLSENKWKCIKLIDDNRHCFGNLNKNNECECEHIEYKYIFDIEKSMKFPYKNTGSLTIKKVST